MRCGGIELKSEGPGTEAVGTYHLVAIPFCSQSLLFSALLSLAGDR